MPQVYFVRVVGARIRPFLPPIERLCSRDPAPAARTLLAGPPMPSLVLLWPALPGAALVALVRAAFHYGGGHLARRLAARLTRRRRPGRRPQRQHPSPDAAAGLLYSASGDGNAYAWDLKTHSRVRAYEGHTDLLHCLALCPQRRQLFSGSEDGSLFVWEEESGAVKTPCQVHSMFELHAHMIQQTHMI